MVSSTRVSERQRYLEEGPSFPVVLTCEAEETFKRAQGEGQGGASITKLSDLFILSKIRAEDVYHFGGPREAELDVTGLTPSEAARQTYQHACRFI